MLRAAGFSGHCTGTGKTGREKDLNELMSDEVYRSLKGIVANRKKPPKELMINGCTGFFLPNYEKCCTSKPLPLLTLHLPTKTESQTCENK